MPVDDDEDGCFRNKIRHFGFLRSTAADDFQVSSNFYCIV